MTGLVDVVGVANGLNVWLLVAEVCYSTRSRYDNGVCVLIGMNVKASRVISCSVTILHGKN